MSNLDPEPDEIVVASTGSRTELLEPRDVPLGGPRSLTVRRTVSERGPPRGTSRGSSTSVVEPVGTATISSGSGSRLLIPRS